MIADVLFVALALAGLLSAWLAIRTRRPAGLSGLALALALVALAYEASGLAIVTLASLGAAALVIRVAEAEPPGSAGARDEGEFPPRRLGRAHVGAAFGVLAAFAFVLVGTWARQYVWTGREITPGTGFGELPALAATIAGAPWLLAVGLALVLVAAACAGPPERAASGGGADA